MFYACLKLLLPRAEGRNLEPQGNPMFSSLLGTLSIWMMRCWKNLWDLPVEVIETHRNTNLLVKRACLLFSNVCFVLLIEQTILGPSTTICFPGIPVVNPAHPPGYPASPTISQKLCASPRHHKSLFVDQELQHKHLLLN